MQDDNSWKQSKMKTAKDSESGSTTAPSVIATALTPTRKFFQPKKKVSYFLHIISFISTIIIYYRTCFSKVIGSFIKTDEWKALGRGCYGEVFRVEEWIDANGKQRGPIALKKANPQPGAETLLQKEMKSLSKLNHLFVVKYLGLVKMEDKNGKR